MNTFIWLFLVYILYRLFKAVFYKKKRRPAFKKLYGLDHRQQISVFERKMAKGMIKEDKEVWVTTFCLNGEVLSVTATICNKRSAHPSDNYYSWLNRANRLGATEIRFYHNHPNVFGKSFFSSIDKKTHRNLKKSFKQTDIQISSFLVYQTILGYRIKENKRSWFL